MAKGAIHIDPVSSFGSNQAAENERRGWDQTSYSNKNNDGKACHHYDWSRRGLNFEIAKGGVIRPLGSDPTSLDQRLQARLKELGFKQYQAKDGVGVADNNPNFAIDIIVGGDHDRLCEIAFGEQDVAYDLSRDNSHITRTKDVEKWALDVYRFACKKWGEDNIIGMEIHLDETTPHAHILAVPVAEVKQKGRLKKGEERKTHLAVSFAKVCGENPWKYAKYKEQLHDDLYAEVGIKWGLERGDRLADLPEEERRGRVHKNAKQLEAERQSKEAVKAAQKEAEEAKEAAAVSRGEVTDLETRIAKNKKTLDSLDEDIKTKQTANDSLQTRLNNLRAEIDKAKEESIDLEDAKGAVASLETEYYSVVNKKKEAEKELDSLTKKRETVLKELAKEREELKSTKDSCEETDKELGRKREEIKSIKDASEKARDVRNKVFALDGVKPHFDKITADELKHKKTGLISSESNQDVADRINERIQKVIDAFAAEVKSKATSFTEAFKDNKQADIVTPVVNAIDLQRSKTERQELQQEISDIASVLCDAAGRAALVEFLSANAVSSSGGGGGSSSGLGWRDRDKDDEENRRNAVRAAVQHAKSVIRPPRKGRGR